MKSAYTYFNEVFGKKMEFLPKMLIFNKLPPTPICNLNCKTGGR